MDMDLDIKNLRYIVFCIDSKHNEHEGVILTSLSEARQEAQDLLNGHHGNKMILASFVLNTERQVTYLHQVEVIDSKTSKKKLEQLDLFKPSPRHGGRKI
jgi:RNA binding exosome subunit